MMFETSPPPPSYFEYYVNVPQHIEEYVAGDRYVQTPDFQFQELMRTSDMAIYGIVKKVFDINRATELKSSGWGQLISAAYLLEQTRDQLKISDQFKKFLEENLNKAINIAATKEDPLKTYNVREFSKAIMMNSTHPTHPHAYLPWKKLNAPAVVEKLNSYIADTHLELRLQRDAILLFVNSEGNSSIFDKIWEKDFSALLEKYGFSNLEQPINSPHLTLVNADQIQKIKNYFDNEENFQAFIQEELENYNALLKEQIDFNFTNLCYTFSFEFSTYTDVIVANVHSELIDHLMKKFCERVKQKLQVEVVAKPMESFHLTIAGKLRESTPFLKDKRIEWIIDNTGKYSEVLRKYWNNASFE